MLDNLFQKDLAGICFSTRGVVIIQQRTGKIKNLLTLPYPSLGGTSEGMLSDDIFEVFKDKPIELVAFLQKAFRDSRLDNNDIVVALPPKDLIIRFFEMPNIPKSEVLAGINFEMKKYIPFKVEELAYDFQYRVKQKANIIEVILCGIRQDPLDRYVDLFKQLKMEVVAFEPGLFSLFRLLVIKNKISSHHSCVILDYGKTEANILIAEKGFPYFTRDIRLAPDVAGAKPEHGKPEKDAVLFRLINEVRVSLDYYKRQFLKKDVDEMIIVSSSEQSGWADNFSKELGLKVASLTLDEFLKVKVEQTDMLSDVSKAFGAALRIIKPSLVTLNFKKSEKPDKLSLALTGVSGRSLEDFVASFIGESKAAIAKGLIAGAVIFAIAYGLGFSKIFPLEKELAAVAVKQPPLLAGVDLATLESLKASEKVFAEKQKDFNLLIEEEDFYKKLILLPSLMPQGVWLNSFEYSGNPTSLVLNCCAYASDEKERTEIIYEFVSNLKENEEFVKGMSLIDLISYREVHSGDIYYMQFDVKCTQ